jgi:hypothetical protein
MNTNRKSGNAGAPSTGAADTDTTAGQAEERKPLPEPAGGWPRDEYTGKSGSYVRDPFTGIRRPAVDTAAAPAADTPASGQ